MNHDQHIYSQWLFCCFVQSIPYFIFYSLQQIISNYMKGSSKKATAIKDFRLLFMPTSIIFFKKNPHSFRIYVEKDMQVIGTVKQLIPPLAPSIKHAFSEFNAPIEFRTVCEKKGPYRIALYQLDSAGIQQFVENSQLKFSKFLEEYYHEFLDIEQQLNTELKSKEPPPFQDIWKNLANNFTKRIFASSVRFQTFGAILDFTIEPIHRYDELQKEAQTAEQKRREKKQKRMEGVYNKTKTISDFVRHDSESNHIKRGHTEDELALLRPFSFEEKRQEANKSQIKEELKSFNITIHPKSKETDKQQSKKIDIQIQNKPQCQTHNMIDLNEEVKYGKSTGQTIQVHEEVQQKETQHNISIEHEKYLLMPQRKSSNKKNDPLRTESIALQASTDARTHKARKENVFLAFALIACFVFAYFLMHPLPKT